MPAAIQHVLECVVLDNPETCSNVDTLSHLIRRICFYKRIYIATNSAIRVITILTMLGVIMKTTSFLT